MPTAPSYQPVPEVAPGPSGTPGVQVSTPIAAFGGTVATALQGLGAKVEHSGDEIFRQALHIQNERNQIEAREADVEYMKRAGMLHAKFNSLEGNAIAAAYPQYIKDLETERQSVRKGMSNPAAAKIYDGPSTSFLGRSVFNGAGAAASGIKQAKKQADAAQLDVIRQTTGANPDDDIGFQESLERTRAVVRSQGKDGGWDPATVEDHQIKAESALKADRIMGMARNQPQTALTMFQHFSPTLTVADRQRAEGVVFGRVAQVAGRNEADAVLTPTLGTPEQKPLKDYLDEGREVVEKMNIEDESLRVQVKNAVEAGVISKYHQAENAKIDFQRLNTSAANNGLLPDPQGKIPQSLDEYFARPGVQDAYNNSDGTHKRQIMNNAVATINRKTKYDDETSYRSYERLVGMANSKETVDKFMDLNPWDPEYRMNPSEIHKVVKLQDAKRKDPSTDPQVKKAMSMLQNTMGAQMRELGITSRADNPDKYNEFTGALFLSIRDYQELNKKNPNEDEVSEMAKRLMFRPPSTTWPFTWLPGNMGKKAPLVQESVPDEFAQQMKSEAYAKGRTAPDEKELKRLYLRQRLLDLYGGSKPESGE